MNIWKRVLVIILTLLISLDLFTTGLTVNAEEIIEDSSTETNIEQEIAAISEEIADTPVVIEETVQQSETPPEPVTETIKESTTPETQFKTAETVKETAEAGAKDAETVETKAKETETETSETKVKESETSETKAKESETETEETKVEETETTETEESETDDTEETEDTAQTLFYEDDDVIIQVSEVTAGAIPEDASLKVVPIIKDDEETGNQYNEVEAKLLEKAADEEYDIAGFLAYDITFVDVDDNKVEPVGDVKVTMDYKQAVVPEEARALAAEAEAEAGVEVTVMHLEEDENGEVKDVVDMNESEQLKVLDTTSEKAVEKAEFVTDSFSTYTLIWKNEYGYYPQTIIFHYVDTNGADIPGKNGTDIKESWGGTIDLTAGEYQYIDGYTHIRTTINSYDNQIEVTSIKRQSNSIFYNGNNSWVRPNGTYDLYFVYEKNENQGGDPGGDTPSKELGIPDHYKTIKKNGTDEAGVDSYTISLNVSGKQKDPDPIDILLVMDLSGSMTTTMDSGKSRIEEAKKAIETLKTQLASVRKSVRFSVIAFSGPSSGNYDAYNDSYGPSLYSDTGDAWYITNGSWIGYDNFDVNDYTFNCKGGTNWQAGVRLANQQMKTANPNAKQYVVFLTDGNPTFRHSYNTTGYYMTSDNKWTYGRGDSDEYGNNYSCAVTQWQQYSSNLTKDTVTRYVVDLNVGTTDDKCKTFAKAIGATNLMAQNASDLEASFKKIADSITIPAYTDVVMQDKLSDYVDFASVNPIIRVYSTDGNGIDKQLSSSQYTLDRNLLDQGIVSVKLLNGGALEKDTTYRVEFEVIPNQKAITGPYNGEEYNGTGDSPDADGYGGTDHASNNPKFSEGQAGYWSNDNANTFLSYKDSGVAKTPSPYPRPVFQVQTTTYSVEKLWKGVTAEELKTLELEVILSATAQTDQGTVDLGEAGYIDLEPIYLTEDGHWTYTWENLPKYYYYYDGNGNAQHAEIQYSADEVHVSEEFEKTVIRSKITDPKDASASIYQTQITNTRKGELTVHKVWSDGAESHSEDTVYAALFKDGEPVMDQGCVVAVKLNAENDWEATFKYLGKLTGYTVKELNGVTLTQTEALTKAILPDETKFYYQSVLDAYAMFTIDDTDYKVSYKEETPLEDGYSGNITITNTKQLNQLSIQKVDAANTELRLSGAQFRLEKKAAGGDWETVKQEDDSDYIVTTGPEGIAVFENLKNGTYRMTEITAPDGYNILKDPIEVTLPYMETASTDDSIDDIETEGFKKADGTYHYHITMTVRNSKIYTLPQSGGIGTYLFTISGVAFLMTALLLFIMNKRKERGGFQDN